MKLKINKKKNESKKKRIKLKYENLPRNSHSAQNRENLYSLEVILQGMVSTTT